MGLKELLKKLKLSEQTISMVLGALVVVVIGVLVFNYFRSVGQEEVSTTSATTKPGEVKLIEEEGKIVPEGLPTTHKVEAGEHLWGIAEKYFGSGYNWVDIAKENNLANPNQLLVGQELTIPKSEVKQPTAKVAATEKTFGEVITGNTYTVVKGDNLWGIAVRTYQDGYQWVKIAQANNLTDPNKIHPGNVLTLPR